MELWTGNDPAFKNELEGLLLGAIKNKFICKFVTQV